MICKKVVSNGWCKESSCSSRQLKCCKVSAGGFKPACHCPSESRWSWHDVVTGWSPSSHGMCNTGFITKSNHQPATHPSEVTRSKHYRTLVGRTEQACKASSSTAQPSGPRTGSCAGMEGNSTDPYTELRSLDATKDSVCLVK